MRRPHLPREVDYLRIRAKWEHAHEAVGTVPVGTCALNAGETMIAAYLMTCGFCRQYCAAMSATVPHRVLFFYSPLAAYHFRLITVNSFNFIILLALLTSDFHANTLVHLC